MSLIILQLFAFLHLTTAYTTTIQTTYGKIEGKLNNQGISFTKVPYAKAPIGSLRWALPQEPSPWPDTLNATITAPGCPQKCSYAKPSCSFLTAEDCLYLNIYKPNTNTHTQMTYPVLIFIHGGNFESGSASDKLFSANELSQKTGIIVVTFNYRLGALGFLYEKNHLQGNFGLYDQKLALKFIIENIHNFGGDINHVTLMGQDSGAISAVLHLLDTENEFEFTNVILQSAPLGIPLRSEATWGSVPYKMFNKLNCVETSFEWSLMDCLRNKSVHQIIVAQNSLVDIENFIHVFMPWSPTVGNEMEQPLESLLYKNVFPDTNSFLMGFNENDAYNSIIGNLLNFKPMNLVEFKALLISIYGFENSLKIRDFYNGINSIDNAFDYRSAFSQITTDSMFKCPLFNVSIKLVENDPINNVYFYNLKHYSDFNVDIWGQNCFNVSCHNSELPYIFQEDLTSWKVHYNAQEKIMAKQMQTFWSHFVKFGDPLNSNVGYNIQWQSFKANLQSIMNFETPSSFMNVSDHLQSVCSFWNELQYIWSV